MSKFKTVMKVIITKNTSELNRTSIFVTHKMKLPIHKITGSEFGIDFGMVKIFSEKELFLIEKYLNTSNIKHVTISNT